MDSFEKEYPDLADVCKHFWDCGIESEQFYTVEISNIESLLKPFSISKKNSFISSYFFEKNLHLDRNSESSSNTNNNIINNKRPHSPEDTIVAEIDNPCKRSNLETPVEGFNFFFHLYRLFLIFVVDLIKVCITEPFTFKKNEIYYLIEGSDQGNFILRKYEKFGKVDFSKVIPIVIYRYINKDPLFYM
ncbi:uncharacterized protein LOC111693430 [Trichogramma pretiosum]|uniref:uncharacterized protein LOC111693430 n=1 Tax=Trichogramma pretiosum TaxID=7493 RepID=UPI000C71AC5F|nr:uncharacterized protein LOC111693430 [Trichogramma pretiosum]